MSKLIALDASSSQVGYTIFDKKTFDIIEINHFTQDKTKSLLERALAFADLLVLLKKKYSDLDEMVIEEAFVAMYGTSSSAATTATLLQINAMYQVVCHYAGLKVNTISVSECRKHTFPGIKLRTLAKQMKLKEKELCFNLATKDLLKNIILPTKVLSKGPRKGQTVYEDYVSDMVDSFIVGHGFLNKK